MPGVKITKTVAKVGRYEIHLVLVISEVGGDASHGSRTVVAPMICGPHLSSREVRIVSTRTTRGRRPKRPGAMSATGCAGRANAIVERAFGEQSGT